MKKNTSIHLPSIIILLILCTAYFYHVIFLDEVFLVGDNFSVNIPFAVFLANSLKQGAIPLWNPYILNGAPFFIGSNIHAFPTLILFFMLPAYKAMTYTTVVITFISGISMYFFSYKLHANSAASVFSAVIYMFSGLFSKAHASSVALLSLMYVPFVLLIIQKGIEENKYKYALIAGAVFFLFFLSGHPMILYITLLFSVFYVFFGIDEVVKNKLKFLGIALCLFGFISFPFITYQLKLASISSRPIDNIHYIQSFALRIKDIPTFILPHIYGIPEIELSQNPGSFFYVGVIPLCLGLYGSSLRNKKIGFFTLSYCIGILLSLGLTTPLYSLILLLPGASFFRQPAYFYVISLFSISILSGFALIKLTYSYKKVRRTIQELVSENKRFILMMITVVLLTAVVYLDRQTIASWKEIVQSIHFLFPQKNIDGLVSKTGKIRFIILYNLSNIVFIMASITAIIGIIKKVSKKEVIQVSFIILVFLDLFFINRAELITIPSITYEKELLSYNPPQFLKDPLIRIISYQTYKAPHWDNFNRESFILSKLKTNNFVLGANRNMLVQMYSINGFNPLISNSFISHTTVDNVPHIAGVTSDDIKLDHDTLNRFGVSYVLSDVKISKDYLTLVSKMSPHSYIYAVNNSSKRIFLTDGVNKECCFNLIQKTPHTTVINTITSKDVDLIILDVFYPGWNAYIDSNKSKVELYDDIFMKVSVPKGIHTITLSFAPY